MAPLLVTNFGEFRRRILNVWLYKDEFSTVNCTFLSTWEPKAFGARLGNHTDFLHGRVNLELDMENFRAKLV